MLTLRDIAELTNKFSDNIKWVFSPTARAGFHSADLPLHTHTHTLTQILCVLRPQRNAGHLFSVLRAHLVKCNERP